VATLVPELSMPVGSVVHALRILRHLAESSDTQGVTAIARQLGISPSSCFNLLKTLEAEDFVHFEPVGKHYSIGPGLARIARSREATDPVVELARPRMQELAARFRVATGLWRLTENRRLVLVASADSDLATRLHMTLGQRLPMFIGAIGRCVAAHQPVPREQLQSSFRDLRWERAPTFTRYQQELDSVRKRGWAVDDGDFMRGLTTLAAPVVDRRDRVRYCLASTLFQGQLEERAITQLGLATAAAAGEIAEDWQPPTSASKSRR